MFGGRGAIGRAVCSRHAALGWAVTATSRSAVVGIDTGLARWVVCNPARGPASPPQLEAGKPYAAVVWAQGANTRDSVIDVDPAQHLEIYLANCVFVLQTLRMLLDRGLLSQPTRLVIVSSIWQRIARQEKLSYIMSKAAIGGLVQSASIDLAGRGVLINAVLPSALDTAMTAASLTQAQIDGIAGATGFGRLISVDEVVAAIEFLCSSRNTGITGQSIAVDLGFSHARHV